MTTGESKNKPDYGVDGFHLEWGIPFVVLVEAAVFAGGGYLTVLPGLLPKTAGALLFLIGLAMGMIMGSWFFYVKGGKLHYRDRLLSLINWRGDERVLDVGTGRGLLMIGAAKKLSTGKSIGIDIWRREDLMDNTPKNTLRNVELEGVLDKVEIQNQDARKMSFPDGYFDVILSNLCLHNIPGRAEREKACQEIVRVLKPGGTAILSDDLFHAKEYAGVFKREGLRVESLQDHFRKGFPLHGIVKAFKKP